jgi:ketosteroid isomerase-like protein
MTRDEIVRIVTATLTRYGSDYLNPEKVLEYVADDVDWQIEGGSVIGGKKTREDLLNMLRTMPQIAATGLPINPTSFIVEGNRAAVEAVGEMRLKDGREYKNRYHFVFELRDGKIVRAREYLDTAAVAEMYKPA